jgi:glutathione S-transferase
MPEIITQREDIRALKGVHLYHFAVSNCSQRVRITLEEKRVPWVDHHVNLLKDEHLNREFRALNPNGVVPVLVHDGRTFVESNDIIEYIDTNFQGPSLQPEGAQDRVFLQETIERSSAVQGALKLLSHEFLFKPARRMNQKQLAKFEAQCNDPNLIAFMREYSSKGGFGDAKIRSAVQELSSTFVDLDARLQDRHWLTGDHYGLADISWIVNVHRLAHMRYPFSRHPALANWLDSVRSRPSFNKAVSGYEARSTRAAFNIYSRLRKLGGTSISHYL